MTQTRLHHRACNLCEAMCGVTVEIAGDQPLRVRGDAEDPLSRGQICPKAVALIDLYQDPDRLRAPVQRGAQGWEPLAWEAALDQAARRIHELQERHGPDAVALYIGNPTVHNTSALLATPLFQRVLRTKNRYSATSVDQLPHMLASYWMLGHQWLMPVPDLDRTNYLLMLGANPAASNGSLMSAPGWRARVEAMRGRGARIVVVDPRHTETAALADAHHPIRPGTDAWLLLALIHEVFRRGPRLGRLEPLVERAELLREAAAAFPPERAELPTGVPAAAIARMAEELLSAERAVVYGRVGASTQPFGALCQVLILALNVLTGNLDAPGGSMFPRPAVDLLTLPRGLGPGPGSFARWTSRVRGLPEFSGELPVATLADEIETPGPGQVRALITLAGNPVLSTPNGRRLDRALAGLELMVSIDPYVNETTRHAHLILPVPSPLERPHYDLVFHQFAVRNTARYAEAALDPGPDAHHDGRVLLALARRLCSLRGVEIVDGLQVAAMGALGLEHTLDLALRQGPYGAGLWPWGPGLSLSELKKHPHGLDLGALEPCLPGRLLGKRRSIDLAPEPALADLARLASEPWAPEPGALSLIGRRDVRDNNSWLHNAPRLMKGRSRCALLIHPTDAAARGLADGDRARVRSRVGEVVVPVALSERMMPGVVSLPHGYGHDRPGVQLTVASRQPGVSANDLNDEQRIDTLSGGAAFSGQPVWVERAEPGERATVQEPDALPW